MFIGGWITQLPGELFFNYYHYRVDRHYHEYVQICDRWHNFTFANKNDRQQTISRMYFWKKKKRKKNDYFHNHIFSFDSNVVLLLAHLCFFSLETMRCELWIATRKWLCESVFHLQFSIFHVVHCVHSCMCGGCAMHVWVCVCGLRRTTLADISFWLNYSRTPANERKMYINLISMWFSTTEKLACDPISTTSTMFGIRYAVCM